MEWILQNGNQTPYPPVMKRLIFGLLFLLPFCVNAQQQKAYGDGEWFKFRIHYGLVTGGYATLEVDQTYLNGKNVYHVKGKGSTTGLTRLFFSVDDDYQSYIDVEKDVPYRFIRKIDEGGHTKDIQIDFNHDTNQAIVFNKKHNKKDQFNFPDNAQDMVSAFYYLRNRLNISTLKVGDVTEMDMFFDKENYRFRLKYLGKEEVRTKFGKVECLIFRPYVQAGRVFKEDESLTVWVSNDANLIPIRIKASLAVGSLKADLIEYKGLKHSFKIQMD